MFRLMKSCGLFINLGFSKMHLPKNPRNSLHRFPVANYSYFLSKTSQSHACILSNSPIAVSPGISLGNDRCVARGYNCWGVRYCTASAYRIRLIRLLSSHRYYPRFKIMVQHTTLSTFLKRLGNRTPRRVSQD